MEPIEEPGFLEAVMQLFQLIMYFWELLKDILPFW